MNMERLLEIGEKAVKHAQKLGVDEAEVFLYQENFISVKFIGGIFASRGKAKGLMATLLRIAEPWIKKKGLPMVSSGIRAGVGVRVVVKKALGFSSISSIEERKVLNAVEEAVNIAKIRPPDPNWASLAEPKEPISKGGIFDKRIQNLDIDELLDMCVNCCVMAGDYDKRITQAMMSISASSTSFGVVNTKNVEVSDKGTSFVVSIGAKARSGNEEVSSGDILFSRSYIEDLQPVALNASLRTIECLGKKTLPEKYVGPVLFENISWSQLFLPIFASGISALNVQENRSVFKGKLEKKVASEVVSVIDDGTLLEGFGTFKIDDEGVPKRKTSIIEKGILRGFLYDNYSAKREKIESTGNASRRSFYGAPPYANQPSIAPSNLMLMPGKGDLEELIGEIKNGILVRGSLIGAFHSNVITGDFSVTAENAFKIENGEIAYPLKACTVAGNLYEALGSVIALGNDLKCFMNVLCPSIIVDNIVVST